jgi:hypothetical protein
MLGFLFLFITLFTFSQQRSSRILAYPMVNGLAFYGSAVWMNGGAVPAEMWTGPGVIWVLTFSIAGWRDIVGS